MKSTYIVTPNFPPDICGIGDYSSFLYKNLLKEGIDAHVISFTENTTEDKRVHIIKSNAKRSISSWLNCLDKKENVETIFIQYEPYSFSKIGIPLYLVYIFLVLKLKGYKISIMFHEVATRLYVANPKKIIVSLLQLFIAYFLTAISSIRITSTSFNARQLKPFKFTLVPIPSNFKRSNIQPEPKNNLFVIGCFANRVDDFFASVIDQIVQRKLGLVYLIGRPSDRNNETWKKHNFYNNENVVITGTLSADQIQQCFDKLTVFIHMEKVDKSGRGGASLKNGSLAAAFYWGLPVITANGDMTDETFLKNRNNIFFVNDSFSVEDWVNSVEFLANNKDMKTAIQKNAFTFYEQNLSWPTITKKYISLLAAL